MVRSQTSTSSRDPVTGSSVRREIEADAANPATFPPSGLLARIDGSSSWLKKPEP
jgi:hypothetical protein